MTRRQQGLIDSCRKLVYWMAHRFLPKGAQLDDLVQAANLGLVQAAQHYDPSRGTKFSFYAYVWMRREIVRELRTACPLHLPRTAPFWLARNHTGLSIQDIERRGRDEPCYKNLVDEILRDQAQGPEEEAARQEEARRLIEKMEGSLDLRERRVLELRYLKAEPQTLEQVGKVIRRTKERARQIQNKSLRKLRHAFSPDHPRPA